MVWPSGSERTTTSLAILVPPPGRFSIRTCCPQLFARRSPSIRAITSVGPPGANGTMMRTGRVGQARARARSEAMLDINRDAEAATLKRRRVMITIFLQLHLSSVTCPLSSDAHRLLEGAAHFRRLAVAVPKGFQARLEQGIIFVLLEREAFHALLLLEERQLDAARQIGVADNGLGIAALRNGVEIVEQALADHYNAEIAGAEIFLAAIGDAALTDPCDDVLVDHVARDPASVLVLDRAHPGRDLLLHIRLAALGHAHEEPRHAERVLVIDRHAPFEMVAEIKAVRP